MTIPRTNRLAHGIVLVTGMVIGLFIWKTYFEPVPHLYPLEFQEGRWLIAPEEGPQGYFRKELYLLERPRQAWLTVAATDSYVIYVNGKIIDSRGYASLNVSGIYDIGDQLRPGKNVLSVVARRMSYPGAAKAAVEGAYIDAAGVERRFASDRSWKSAATEQRQGGGEISWYADFFDATSWPPATAAGRPASSEVYPLETNPLAYSMAPQGRWLGVAGSASERVSLSSTLTLDAPVDEAWIRIASAQPSLLINGVTIQGEEISKWPTIRLPGARPGAGRTPAVTTDLYNLTPFLHAGANRVTLSLLPSAHLPGFYLDGFMIRRGEIIPFGVDSTWRVDSPSIGSGEAPSAVTLADHTPLPIKRGMAARLPFAEGARRGGTGWMILLATAGSIYLLWRGTSRVLTALRGEQAADAGVAGVIDALGHLPVLLFLGGLFLLRFDVRFDPALPFQGWVVWSALGFLLLLKGIFILEATFGKGDRLLLPEGPLLPFLFKWGEQGWLVALIAAGAYLRFSGLDAQSLYHDEIHMVNFVQGFLERGYPYKMIGPIERPLATYEAVPYPIALSVGILGISDLALRLPAALFGTATILLVYFAGKDLLDRRVGLLAAAIYAFCPQALIWAKYLWHPQQAQFFALLTAYFFYRAIRETALSPRYLYLTAVSFIITYLSWEGTGFLLPGLGLALLAVKGRDFTWLRDKHLWIAIGMVAVAIVIQLTRRLLQQVPYIVVGSGLSDVSLPTLFFLDPMYDPAFYMKNFLWLENNAILTLLVVGGLFFCFRQRGFVYIATLLFSILLLKTNLLSHAAVRYAYYVQPFLILPASLTAFSLWDRIKDLARGGCFSTLRPIPGITMGVFFLAVVFGSTGFMKLYRINQFAHPSGIHIRADAYYIDYRSASEHLKSDYRSDDLVIAVVPNTLEYYSSIESKYFMENHPLRQVLYDPTESSPRYLERVAGKPVIRDLSELQDVLGRHRRAWIVAAPYTLFSFLIGPEAASYITKNGKVTYESYNARVYLMEN